MQPNRKNHFISTLATASTKFPMSYWNKLFPLADNCLLPWQPTNPAISAYHGFTGAPFDFCAHPIAPAGTSILIHEALEKRGTWAEHGDPGYYLSHVIVTATSASRVTDTIAWFPETDITSPPPPPNATELFFAAIKDFSRAIKQFNLTGNFVPPTLVQDLDALASLSAGSSKLYTFPTTNATSSTLAPASRTEPRRVVQPAVHNPSLQEIRVMETPPQVDQEPRVVFSTLAIVTPVYTAPLATCSMIMPQSTLHLPVPSLPHPSTSILMVPRSSTVPPRMVPKARTGTLSKPLKSTDSSTQSLCMRFICISNPRTIRAIPPIPSGYSWLPADQHHLSLPPRHQRRGFHAHD
jgi:hypothetical protein